MSDLLGIAALFGLPLITGAIIGFSKGYWQGHRDGFSACRKARENGDG